MRTMLFASAGLLALTLLASTAEAQVYTRRLVTGAVNRALPRMEASAFKFQQVMGKVCFSCHHQSLPALAYAAAEGRGFAVNSSFRRSQSDYVYNFVKGAEPVLAKAVREKDAAAEKALDARLVDPVPGVAYALFGLAEDGRAPDATLGLLTEYLAKKQDAEGYWPVWGARPPLEGSEFTSTALSIRALRTYAPAEFQPQAERQIARGKVWLLTAPARSTEDKAFRLLGLRWAGAPEGEIRTAARALLDDQRDDGGWAQLPGKSSDAYATGQALIALHRGGDLPVTHSAYTRGAAYLLLSQKADGTWHVAKRALPAQPYFESAFPHGKDQYISISGTAWAVAALALTVEPVSPVASIRE